jgi:hypothetical protein
MQTGILTIFAPINPRTFARRTFREAGVIVVNTTLGFEWMLKDAELDLDAIELTVPIDECPHFAESMIGC